MDTNENLDLVFAFISVHSRLKIHQSKILASYGSKGSWLLQKNACAESLKKASRKGAKSELTIFAPSRLCVRKFHAAIFLLLRIFD